jgi:hypothetical protein
MHSFAWWVIEKGGAARQSWRGGKQVSDNGLATMSLLTLARQPCRDAAENPGPRRKPTGYEESPSQPIGQLTLNVFWKRLGFYQADGETSANGGGAERVWSEVLNMGRELQAHPTFADQGKNERVEIWYADDEFATGLEDSAALAEHFDRLRCVLQHVEHTDGVE